MPSAFSITVATNDVLLDKNGQGLAALTVSNVSGHPQRGRVILVPGQATKAEWLSTTNGAERDFPVGGTQQYTIQIAVAQGTPSGRYTFRPDVVAVQNPDEDSTQGPTIAFEVPEAPPPPKPQPFPWWIVAVAVAVVLVVGGTVIFLLSRQRQATVHTSGQLVINQTFQVDLDNAVIASGPTADVWFEAVTATQRFLAPLNGARLANVGTQTVGKSGCESAPLSTAPIPITNLPAGTHLCVKTNEGRFSEVEIVQPAVPFQTILVIRFTTWD